MLNKVYNDLTIWVCVKEFSTRCHNKNENLLYYTLKYLYDCNVDTKIVNVLCDNYEFTMRMKEKYGGFGFNFITQEHDCTRNELTAIYEYITQHCSHQTKYHILLPVTQPLRDASLLDRMYQKLITCGEDKVCFSVNPAYKNRLLFDNTREKFSVNELSKDDTFKMIDGAMYGFTLELFKHHVLDWHEVCDFMANLWEYSHKEFVENNIPFIDINTLDDYNQFYNLVQFFKEK